MAAVDTGGVFNAQYNLRLWRCNIGYLRRNANDASDNNFRLRFLA